MYWGWPQITMFAFLALSFAVHCKCAGEPKGPYDPVLNIIDVAIWITLLYFGGFWTVARP